MEFEPENQESVPEEADSYDELAAEEAELPPKRGRGRPKGSKNKSKDIEPPPPDLGVETSKVEEPEETPPPTPKPKPRKSRPKPRQIPVLDVEFDDGYGATGPPKKPVRLKIKEPPRAQSVPSPATSTPTDLMHVLATFAKEHGTREKDRRRGFYEMYLPTH